MWTTGNDIFMPLKSCIPQGDVFMYVDIDAIDNKRNIITKPKRIPTKHAPSRATRYIQAGDTLFSMVRPYLRNIACVPQNGWIASTGFYVCSPTKLITQEYCYYLMLSDYVVNGLNQFMKGDNSPSINNGHITSWLYPVPPLEEQSRIVEEIEHWFTLVDLIEQGKANLDNTIQKAKNKILDLAIHGRLVPQDPNDEPAIELLKRTNPSFIPCDNAHYPQLPKSWCLVQLQDLCSLYDGEKRSNHILPYIDVKYLRGGKAAEMVASGKFVKKGSLLILVDGENSGEVFLSSCDGYQGSTFKQLKINNNVYEEYVLLVIQMSRKMLRENKVGSAIPHLDKKIFRAIQVYLPPYQEQIRIVEEVEKLNRVLVTIMESL